MTGPEFKIDETRLPKLSPDAMAKIREVAAKAPKLTEAEKQELARNYKPHRSEGMMERYVNGWKEDFKGVQGSKSFGEAVVETGKAVVKRTRKGFKSLDTVNPLTYAKEPVKDLAGKVDKMVDDGNNNNLSTPEKLWEIAKGAGDTVDYLTTTEGMWAAGATVLGLSSIGAGAAAADAFTVAGTVVAGDGIKDAVIAETKEDARTAGESIASGTMMATGGLVGKKAVKKAKAAAEKANMTAKPETLKETKLSANEDAVIGYTEDGFPITEKSKAADASLAAKRKALKAKISKSSQEAVPVAKTNNTDNQAFEINEFGEIVFKK